jgi:hypothetical protein
MKENIFKSFYSFVRRLFSFFYKRKIISYYSPKKIWKDVAKLENDFFFWRLKVVRPVNYLKVQVMSVRIMLKNSYNKWKSSYVRKEQKNIYLSHNKSSEPDTLFLYRRLEEIFFLYSLQEKRMRRFFYAIWS